MPEIKPFSTRIDLWQKHLQSIPENFIQSITNLISLQWWDADLQWCHNGYLMSTEQGGNYCFGEKICQWLSLIHQDDQPQLIRQLIGIQLIQIGYGHNFVAILTESGLVYLCGEHSTWNTNHLLKPIRLNLNNGMSLNQKFKQIACGYRHLLLLTQDNKIFAMGWNLYGQLTGELGEDSYELMIDTGLQNIKKMVCGYAHSLAITKDFKIYSWGNNRSGQLACNLNTRQCYTKPILLEFFEYHSIRVKDIVAGRRYSFFLMMDGTMFGCGGNKHGQIGSNSYALKEFNLVQLPLTNVQTIAPIGWPYNFSLAFTSNCCWVWGWLDGQKLLKPTKINRSVESFSEATSLYFQAPITFGWSIIDKSNRNFFVRDGKLVSIIKPIHRNQL